MAQCFGRTHFVPVNIEYTSIDFHPVAVALISLGPEIAPLDIGSLVFKRFADSLSKPLFRVMLIIVIMESIHPDVELIDFLGKLPVVVDDEYDFSHCLAFLYFIIL